MTSPHAAVLVVNFHSAARVAGLLDDLSHSDARERLIVSVLDNSEDPAELSELRKIAETNRGRFQDVIVTDAGGNLGYAGGNNAAYGAVAGAAFDVVIVCNPDIRVSAGNLSELIDAPSLREIGVAVPRTSEDGHIGDGRAAIHMLTGRSRKLAPGEVVGRRWLAYPGGHFTVFSRALWTRLGGLSEDFFLYSEEADVVLRARILADERVASTALTVEHDSGGTTGSQAGARSRATLFHAARSSVILFRKHPRLRPSLPAVILSRLGFALMIWLRRGPGSVVIAGVVAGVRYPIDTSADGVA